MKVTAQFKRNGVAFSPSSATLRLVAVRLVRGHEVSTATETAMVEDSGVYIATIDTSGFGAGPHNYTIFSDAAERAVVSGSFTCSKSKSNPFM